MTFIATYGKEIVALLVPVITWVLNVLLKSKVKLQVALPHQFVFLVQQPLLDGEGNQVSPTQTVRTNSFIIRNAGKEPATKVELVFNWKPMCINVWPVRHYEEHLDQDGRYILIFDSLSPTEVLGIEVLSVNGELPNLITVRSTQCVAQNIEMYPQPIVSSSLRIMVTMLMAIGLAATIYLLIILIQFLVLQTPVGH